MWLQNWIKTSSVVPKRKILLKREGCDKIFLNVDDISIVSYHHSTIIMSAMASQISGVSTVCIAVCLGADRRKRQSSTSLNFVRESTGDWRIPIITGQWRRKCFHLMTSSCGVLSTFMPCNGNAVILTTFRNWLHRYPDSKVHGGPHVGPMNFAIWIVIEWIIPLQPVARIWSKWRYFRCGVVYVNYCFQKLTKVPLNICMSNNH